MYVMHTDTERRNPMKKILATLALTAAIGGLQPITAASAATTGNEVVSSVCASSRGMFAYDRQTGASVVITPCHNSRQAGMWDADMVRLSSATCARYKGQGTVYGRIYAGPLWIELGDLSLSFQVEAKRADGSCPKFVGT